MPKLESQHIEWKVNWRDDYLRWVCGFANAQGGRLEIGKNDAGEVVGLPDAGKLLEGLPNKGLIDSVLLDPRAPDELAATLAYYFKEKIGFQKEVRRSALYKLPAPLLVK